MVIVSGPGDRGPGDGGPSDSGRYRCQMVAVVAAVNSSPTEQSTPDATRATATVTAGTVNVSARAQISRRHSQPSIDRAGRSEPSTPCVSCRCNVSDAVEETTRRELAARRSSADVGAETFAATSKPTSVRRSEPRRSRIPGGVDGFPAKLCGTSHHDAAGGMQWLVSVGQRIRNGSNAARTAVGVDGFAASTSARSRRTFRDRARPASTWWGVEGLAATRRCRSVSSPNRANLASSSGRDRGSAAVKYHDS